MNVHLIRNIERDGSCIYCSERLPSEKWDSFFAQVQHYKCVLCKCGKDNCVRVDFIGSGHDSWSGLEDKVTRSTSIKVIKKDVRILR